MKGEMKMNDGKGIFSDDYDISNLADIRAISGYVKITGNLIISSDLINLFGLESLTYIGGSLEISNNTALTSLAGLNNLTSIVGGLWISNNGALTNLDALSNLTSVGGDIAIYNNSTLVGTFDRDSLNTALANLQNHKQRTKGDRK